MQRVFILGMAGAGKSRFARELSRITGLPVCHTDELSPPFTGTAEAERQLEAMLLQPAWIIDNIHRDFRQRIALADTLILIDQPLGLRLVRVLRRWASGGIGQHPDFPFPKLLWLVWVMLVHKQRTERRHAGLFRMFRRSRTCILLQGDRQIEAFLDALAPDRVRPATRRQDPVF